MVQRCGRAVEIVFRGARARGGLRRCVVWRGEGVDGVEAAAPVLGRRGGADGGAVAPTCSGELAPVAFLHKKNRNGA